MSTGTRRCVINRLSHVFNSSSSLGSSFVPYSATREGAAQMMFYVALSCQKAFLLKVTKKTKEKLSRKSNRKKRGKFTKEQMKTKLGWSKFLCQDYTVR